MTININTSLLTILKVVFVIVKFIVVTVAYSIVTLLIMDVVAFVVTKIRRRIRAVRKARNSTPETN